MDRRKSIKTLIVGGVSASVLVEACKPGEEKPVVSRDVPKASETVGSLNRMPEEKLYEKELKSKTFFTSDEMATITILGDIIIPKDNVSGSASEAKVPDFIEFIVKDMPEHQIPLRGGLRWTDLQCLNRFGKPFKDCTSAQQIELVDEIAYPKKAKKQMAQGVHFFSLMRNLVSTGFYTTEMGWKDVGYLGNVPNQWNGVPDEVLKQYNLAYTEKELKECISYS